MNARQKAKHYKRLYSELLSRPMPKFSATNYRVDTLSFQRLYPDIFVPANEDELTDIIVRDLALELMSQLDKYVTVTTSREPYINRVKVIGEVMVVRKESV